MLRIPIVFSGMSLLRGYILAISSLKMKKTFTTDDKRKRVDLSRDF